MFLLHSRLCRRRCQTTQYVHFALHLWLPRTPTPPLASGLPTRQHYQHNVLWCLSIVRWVIWWINEAIVGMTVAPTITLCIHPVTVTSTCQESVPFAPFAGGGDTLAHYSYRGVVWVNITSARNPKLEPLDAWHAVYDRLTATTLMYQPDCRTACGHRQSLQGGLGAKPLNADAPAIFFLLTCARMCFLALFGPKPWNYYFDVFYSFHNYPYVQPKRGLKTITEQNMPWIFRL